MLCIMVDIDHLIKKRGCSISLTKQEAVTADTFPYPQKRKRIWGPWTDGFDCDLFWFVCIYIWNRWDKQQDGWFLYASDMARARDLRGFGNWRCMYYAFYTHKRDWKRREPSSWITKTLSCCRCSPLAGTRKSTALTVSCKTTIKVIAITSIHTEHSSLERQQRTIQIHRFISVTESMANKRRVVHRFIPELLYTHANKWDLLYPINKYDSQIPSPNKQLVVGKLYAPLHTDGGDNELVFTLDTHVIECKLFWLERARSPFLQCLA